MPFHQFNESQLRQICKVHVETLELWLRRLVDSELSASFGNNYYEMKYDGEHYLLNKKIRDAVDFRIKKDTDRFSRWIDATLIEHVIDIICNPKIYENQFKKVFDRHFALGGEHLRIYLDRLSVVRNTVYHSNPVSVHDAERTICYSNDVILAIKDYYMQANKQTEFNVPTIVKYSDTMGSSDYLGGKARQNHGIVLDKRGLKLRVGDKMSFEIEIDASFEPSDYEINWVLSDFDATPFQKSNRLTITFDESHIGEHYHIQVLLVSKKKWHRFKHFDDRLAIMLKILPPPEDAT